MSAWGSRMTNAMNRPMGRRSVLAGAAALGVMGGAARAQAPNPRRGGVLRAAYNTEQANLNPALLASNAVYLVASKVIEQLGEMDALDGTLRPLLATGWQGTPD